MDEIVPVETEVTVAGGSFKPAKIGLEPIRWQGVVFLGWLVGMLVFSVLLLQRARFVKGLLAQAKEADRDLLDLLRRCRGNIGVKEKVKLKLSLNMVSPAVCGIFGPTILLPEYLIETLSGEKLRTVLIHELAHIKRRD
ncbi:MAG: M56 family metallopeptidase, partial [Planctomycetota bacterium]